MTTIAYRAGVLCSDSRCSQGSIRTAHIRKLARGNGGIGGAAGPVVGITAFLTWIENGAAGEPNVADGVSGLLIRYDGTVWLAESGGPLTLIEGPFFAEGSGSQLAIGAMEMRATAEEAVHVACRRDGGSGGPIQTMRLHPDRPAVFDREGKLLPEQDWPERVRSVVAQQYA